MTRNRTKVWDLNYVTVIMSATTKGYGCTRARVTEASELIAADVFTAFEKTRQRITFGDVERYLAQLANHSRDCGCGRCGLAPQPRSCSAWDPDLDSPKGTNRGEPATGGRRFRPNRYLDSVAAIQKATSTRRSRPRGKPPPDDPLDGLRRGQRLGDCPEGNDSA